VHGQRGCANKTNVGRSLSRVSAEPLGHRVARIEDGPGVDSYRKTTNKPAHIATVHAADDEIMRSDGTLIDLSKLKLNLNDLCPTLNKRVQYLRIELGAATFPQNR
jgi:hypothetical protein